MTSQRFSKKVSKRLMLGVVSLGTVTALAACGQPTDTAMSDPATQDPAATQPDTMGEDPMAAGMDESVVDVAANDDSFSTLSTAIEAAGLTQTLAEGGPYTVFAPTNEAFEALPEGTLEQLLQPENQELLAQILAYHVVPEEVMSADAETGEVQTVAGQPVSITVDETTGTVMVNNAMVIQPDVEASNGVIHAVDQVILPPGLQI